MSYSRTTQFNSRRQGNYGRNRNTVSNAIIIALLLTLLGLLYLTQAGSVSGYDYESNDVSNKISTLTEQKSDLAVENARLTALQSVKDSSVAQRMATPADTQYVSK